MAADYIKDIRKKVGHEPIFMPTGACIVINYQTNEVLLQQRSDTNKWAIHGGAMELGESAYQTMCRELKEETNLTVLNAKFFKVYSGPGFHCVYPNKDEVYLIDHVFIVDQYSGTLKADPKEVKQLKWYNLDSIPWDNLMETNEIVFKDFLEEYRMQKEVK